MSGYADLKGKKILITGANRGVGFALTQSLLAEGAIVYAFVRHPFALNESRTGQLHVLRCDLENLGEIYNACSAIESIDGLVCNAGYFKGDLIENLELSEFQKTIRINLESNFILIKHLWPKLKISKSASVVLVSSLAGVGGIEKFPTAAAYTASKMALTGLMEVLAAEGKPFHIRVNAVSPGAIDTEMLRTAHPEMKPDFTADDVARTIRFFLSEDSAPVSGTNYVMLT